ncbi:MAG: hypothetical protein RLZ98_1534 [Pseudomonadota bacterium]|jgi:3-oxoacyl-[acyl-carrier protein] reductase
MDLGIKGRKAIVCAASKGLGRGCAEALAREGVDLTICARGLEELEKTAQAIRSATGVNVTAVQCDVTTAEGREKLLAACPEPDILINNAAGPPPGDFRNFSIEDWRKAVEANMLSPIALIHDTVYGMVERKFGRVLNIVSYTVMQPDPKLELSNGARSGLVAAVSSLARRTVKDNVTINSILPGPFDTDRLRATSTNVANVKGISFEQAHAERMAMVPAGRFGEIPEFGAVAAFLCSAHAGYITAQNVLVDGGSYGGTW